MKEGRLYAVYVYAYLFSCWPIENNNPIVGIKNDSTKEVIYIIVDITPYVYSYQNALVKCTTTIAAHVDCFIVLIPTPQINAFYPIYTCYCCTKLHIINAVHKKK